MPQPRRYPAQEPLNGGDTAILVGGNDENDHEGCDGQYQCQGSCHPHPRECPLDLPGEQCCRRSDEENEQEQIDDTFDDNRAHDGTDTGSACPAQTQGADSLAGSGDGLTRLTE